MIPAIGSTYPHDIVSKEICVQLVATAPWYLPCLTRGEVVEMDDAIIVHKKIPRKPGWEPRCGNRSDVPLFFGCQIVEIDIPAAPRSTIVPPIVPGDPVPFNVRYGRPPMVVGDGALLIACQVVEVEIPVSIPMV